MGKDIPNKLINQNILCSINIFSYVMKYLQATSDNSFAYIPTNSTTDSHKIIDNKEYVFSFDGKDDTNGYADLGIGFLKENSISDNRYIKVIHVNTLHQFSIDSSIFTFNEDLEKITYMIYSDFEYKETNNKKIILIPATTLFRFFETLNLNGNTQFIDLLSMKNILQQLGDYSIIDIDDNFYKSLNKGDFLNIQSKLASCKQTLDASWYNLFTPKKKGIAFSKTHFGNQYTITCMQNGKSFNFRDSYALMSFCLKYRILKDGTKFEQISKKCNYQTNILLGKTPEKYSCNLYRDSNNIYWFISKRTLSDNEINSSTQILENIKIIFTTLLSKSKKWSSKFSSMARVFLVELSKFIKRIKKQFSIIISKVINILMNENFSKTFIFNHLKFSKLLIPDIQ